jgi:hypothetical protein
MAYKFGALFGRLINLSFYGFFLYDGYTGIRDNKNIALDVLGIVVLLFLQGMNTRIQVIFNGIEFLVFDTYEKNQKKENEVDNIFNDLTKDL